MNENFQAAINPNLFDYNFSLKSWITRSQCKLTTVKLSLTCYQNLKSSFTYDYIFCHFFLIWNSMCVPENVKNSRLMKLKHYALLFEFNRSLSLGKDYCILRMVKYSLLLTELDTSKIQYLHLQIFQISLLAKILCIPIGFHFNLNLWKLKLNELFNLFISWRERMTIISDCEGEWKEYRQSNQF